MATVEMYIIKSPKQCRDTLFLVHFVFYSISNMMSTDSDVIGTLKCDRPRCLVDFQNYFLGLLMVYFRGTEIDDVYYRITFVYISLVALQQFTVIHAYFYELNILSDISSVRRIFQIN